MSRLPSRRHAPKVASALAAVLLGAGLVAVSAAPAAAVLAPLADQRLGWTVTADSEELVGEDGKAANVLDGNPATIWHTRWQGTLDPLPHTLTLDMHVTSPVAGFTYVPRPAAGGRNGVVGQYRIETSLDATVWTLAVSGTLPDTSVTKTMTFPSVSARYVRLVALSEAGGRGPWSSAAEIDLVLPTPIATPTPTPSATVTVTATATPTATPDPSATPTAAPAALPPRSQWLATADSAEIVGEDGKAANVLDGDPTTIWHTGWSSGDVPLPHTLTLDTLASRSITALTYTPRPASGGRNGVIGQFRIEISADATTWTTPATGTFADASTPTTVPFGAVTARYVRLVALTEAGGRGAWSSAAEIDLTSAAVPTGTPSPTATPTASPTPSPTQTPASLPPRAAWTAAADSQETAGENGAAQNVLDGNPATIWHTGWSSGNAPLPHVLTLDTKALRRVSALVYTPRPATTGRNGNVGQYTVQTSLDGAQWSAAVAAGAFADDATTKTVSFPSVVARYVRLAALTEAGGRGSWSSAAEVDLMTAPTSVLGGGAWGAPIVFPLVPAAAAVLPNGRVLTWASYVADNAGLAGQGKTESATVDIATGVVSARTISNTGHDMFCPGLSLLADGSVLVQGGGDSDKASRYDPASDAWSIASPLAIPRGYQSSVTLGDGSVFSIGGSWSGGYGGKNGELWTPTGTHLLPGAPVAPILTADIGGIFRQDNQAWLFAWTGDRVFHAGPSRATGWYGTAGDGSWTPTGNRGTDADAMNGMAVMYDTGKILTTGGAPDYSDSVASARTHLIDLSGASPVVTEVDPMRNARAFANAVVLPDGTVLIVGGQGYAKPYTDATAVLRPELWDPTSRTFTELAAMAVPRTYHSWAVLLPDARVLAGGGGLCGTCETNHKDAEIFTPPYLVGAEATRPVITAAPMTAALGSTVAVTTDRAVAAYSLVRMSSATHSVDTDQRRISLPVASRVGNTARLTLPGDAGVLVPGSWMLFAMDDQGVPSIAATIRVG